MLDSWEKIIDNNFICAEDIGSDGSEFVATITDIDFKECFNKDAGKKEMKQSVSFAECKPLVLNKTNAKKLRELFDPENDNPSKCVGKKVTLYVTTIKAFGKYQTCIRLKEYSGQKCELCGKAIAGTATMNIAKVVKYSKQHCDGKIYCMACMKKIAKEREAKQNEQSNLNGQINP